MKKLGVLLLLAGAAAGAWFYFKKKKSGTQPGNGTASLTDAGSFLAPASTTDQQAATISTTSSQVVPVQETAEDRTFKQMSAVLEADPIWKTNVFPGDFYEAVAKDYAALKGGAPRTPEYNYGKPGSFMSVTDAWKDAMKISKATHEELWRIYSAWRSELSKSSMLNFAGIKIK